jgi:hypothetical protein
VNVEYVDLVDYLAIAAEVTGLDVDTVTIGGSIPPGAFRKPR